MARLVWLLPCSLAAGCAGDITDRAGTGSDPLRPPGLAAAADAVDPVVVGDRLLAAGEGDLAIASYLRAAAGPGGLTPRIRHAVARAHLAEGRLGEADRLLREVIALEPDNASARNDLGVALLERGRAGEAHAPFRSAYALAPLPGIRENLRMADAFRGTMPTVPATGSAQLVRQRGGVVTLTDARPDPHDPDGAAT